jgi:hypothetical protein
MVVEPSEIETAVSKLVQKRMPKGVRAVHVEPSDKEDGDEFLLVTVELSSADIDDEALERLLEEIEAEVATLDERYPSVRFLDAA